VLDYEARFKEAVIDRFAASYAAGETLHAWHWVKTGDSGAGPARTLKPKQGLMGGYEPEYMDV